MSYGDNKVAITEGSWDLPRSFYDVEVFGNKGSVAMKYPKTLELVIGTEKKPLELGTLDGVHAEPIRYFVDCIRNKRAVEGVVAGDFNVNVMQIVEAAKRSAASGNAVSLPLQ
mgnify:FL=1